MKIAQILEARQIGNNLENLIRQIQQGLGTHEYDVDYCDFDDEEYDEFKNDPSYKVYGDKDDEWEVVKVFKGEDLVWIDSREGEVVFTVGPDLEDREMTRINRYFAKFGYKVDKDFEWMIGYGDDMPNAFVVQNPDMLFVEKIRNIILDFVGPNCYS